MSLPTIARHLVEGALDGRRDVDLLARFCDDLAAQGLPLLRVAIASEYLHPTLEVRMLLWRRGEGTEAEGVDRRPENAPEPEGWLRSTFYRMFEEKLAVLHLPIDAETVERYVAFDDFAAAGGRDYLAFRQPLDRCTSYGESEAIFLSFVAERGLTADEVSLLTDLRPLVILAIGSVVNVGIGRNLLETYLGRDAAGRVFAGNVVRGRTETMRAVIWYSDLKDFTKLTDTLPAAEILQLLNEYAEPVVDAVNAEGGEVLKFMGDGVLAIFSGPDAPGSRAAAIRAWERACAASAEISAARRERGAATTQLYLALHAGEVLYGNIGGRDRLDFTVLGPSVNEAARLAAMCRSLDQDLVVSDIFVERCGEIRERMVGLGRYALRGVGQPQMLWTLAPED